LENAHSRRRSGATLVEVLISLVLLAIAGVGLITFLGQSAHTLRQLRDDERRTRVASAQLDRLVLWGRSAFLERIGRSRTDGWTIDVRQIGPDLFDVTVAASDTSAVLLRTTVYRPDSSVAEFP
jgi:Tfp pilus assembly protein PilV